MKMYKKAAQSQGYILSYDKNLRVYKACKDGFLDVVFSKQEFDVMPVWIFVQKLSMNDEVSQ